MKKLICIDAGHGGNDPGAVNKTALEKVIALNIALKLKACLIKNGFEIFLTRETDIFDAPYKKAEKANKAKADLFISIHCNAATNESANGAETLAYDLSGESGKLAQAIHKSYIYDTKFRDRGVKLRKDLAVLNSTNMPAILLETGFISNRNECAFLISEQFQEKAAEAVCKGICDYIGIKYKEVDILENKITVESAKKIIKEKCDFDDNTMMYLGFYKYSDSMLIRLAEKIEKL